MSEEHRENRDNRDNQHRHQGRDNYNRNHRGGRDRDRGGRNFRQGQGRSGGRVQRPLLTSALNGAGLCLVALAILYKGTAVSNESVYLGLATVAFIFSALISYFAQRLSDMKWLEKLSDLFFFVGALLMLVVGAQLGDVVNYLGM